MKLKKKLEKIGILVLFILSIMAISGCNNSKYTADYDSSDISTAAANTTFDNNEGQYYMSNGSAAAENGYYYITKNHTLGPNSTNTYFLYYYDMTSQTAVSLCSKLECKHIDSDCDAYISDNECLGHMIWYYDERLFMIERTDESDYLVSYDKEGRNKEKVCVLSDGEAVVGFKNSVENSACVNNGCLYYETYDSKNNYINLKKVDIKGSTNPQDIGTVPVNPDALSFEAFRFYPLKDKIYVFEKQYLSESDTTYSIYQYNDNEKNLSSVVEFKSNNISNPYRGNIYKWNSNMVVDNGGNIYYITELDGDKLPKEISEKSYNKTCILNKFNVSTSTNTELYVLEGTSDKISLPDSLIINGYDGNYIYFYEKQMPSVLEKRSLKLIEDANNLVVMKSDGSIVEKIHFTINPEFWNKYFKGWGKGNLADIEIIPGDERYMMLVTTEKAIEGIECSEEYIKLYKSSSSNFNETEILAVFDKKQIGTGTHTWIKVKE